MEDAEALFSSVPDLIRKSQQDKPIMAWLQRLVCHGIASGLYNKTKHEQVGTLLYINFEYTIVTTVRANQESSSFTEVRAAFNSFFAAWRNTIVEQARLNTRKQALEESVDTFIQNLYI